MALKGKMKSLAVLIIAILLTVHYSDSIPTKFDEFAEQVRKMTQEVYPDNQKSEQIIENGENERYCYDTPCGWNTFNPITRRNTRFMPNTCKCPDETYKCVRMREKVSMSAYVYYCRQNSTVEDELPDYTS